MGKDPSSGFFQINRTIVQIGVQGLHSLNPDYPAHDEIKERLGCKSQHFGAEVKIFP
jgi:hypothetical protein